MKHIKDVNWLPVSSTVLGRVCMGRLGYVPSLVCAEFVMGRVCHVPSLQCAELSLNRIMLYHPNFECPSVRPSVCLFVCLSDRQQFVSVL